MSKNLGGLVNGNLPVDNSKNNNVSANNSQNLRPEDVSELPAQEEEEEAQADVPGRSCFIFAHDNGFRLFLRAMIANSYFSGLIYSLIGLNSILLALDEP